MWSSWILFPRNLFSFLMQLLDNEKKWLRNLGRFRLIVYGIRFRLLDPMRCRIHWVLYTPKYCIRAADVAVQKLSLFLQAISKSNSIAFPEFVICMIIHLPSQGEFHRILVDLVRRSNKDSFHRETESTLKLSVLDKVTPKYCSWFLAVIQRLFSPGRHPFLNIIGVDKPDSRFPPTCFSL